MTFSGDKSKSGSRASSQLLSPRAGNPSPSRPSGNWKYSEWFCRHPGEKTTPPLPLLDCDGLDDWEPAQTFWLLDRKNQRGSSLEAWPEFIFIKYVNYTLDSRYIEKPERMDVSIIVSLHTFSTLLLIFDKIHKVLNFSVGGGRLAQCSNWRSW